MRLNAPKLPHVTPSAHLRMVMAGEDGVVVVAAEADEVVAVVEEGKGGITTVMAKRKGRENKREERTAP